MNNVRTFRPAVTVWILNPGFPLRYLILDCKQRCCLPNSRAVLSFATSRRTHAHRLLQSIIQQSHPTYPAIPHHQLPAQNKPPPQTLRTLSPPTASSPRLPLHQIPWTFLPLPLPSPPAAEKHPSFNSTSTHIASEQAKA